MKQNYPYTLWLQLTQGTHLGKNSMLFLGLLVFVLFSSFNLVGQSNDIPSFQHLNAKDRGNASVGTESNITVAVDTDSKGNVYLLTFGNGVFKYNQVSGTFTKIITDTLGASGNLNSPLDLAIDNNDIIHIADGDSKLIKKFTTNGVPAGSIGLGVGGNGKNEFWEPTGIEFDSDNNLFVVDAYRGSNTAVTQKYFLKIYYSDGRFKSFQGTSGHPINNPYRVAANDNYILISHSENNGEVLVFNKDLSFNKILTDIGSPGSLFIDASDFVYAVDYDDRLNFSQIFKLIKGTLPIFPEGFNLYNNIEEGINESDFKIRIYDSNLNVVGSISEPKNTSPNKDNLQLPIDLGLDKCSNLYLNDANIATFLTLNFDLEIYNRTPSFDTEKPIIVNCVPDQNATLVNGEFKLPDYASLAVFDVLDNCDNDLTITQDPKKDSVITRTTAITITATDDAGNFASCNFMVFIEDAPLPLEATCKPVTLFLDSEGNATLTPAQVYDGNATADNMNLSLNKTSFTCADLGDGNEVTLTVTDKDDSSRFDSCTAIITVLDDIKPVAKCIAPGKEFVLNNGSVTISASDIDNDSKDNCEIAKREVSPSTFTSTGTKTVTLTITDVFNNIDECTTAIEVLPEEQAYNFQCIGALTVKLGENAQNSSVTEIETSEFITSDISNLDLELRVQQFTCDNVGTFDLPINATDKTTQEIYTCIVQVTVLDVGAPLIICQAEYTINIPEGGYEVPNFFENRVSDNCNSIDELVLDQDVPAGTLLKEAGTYRIKLTARDTYNNVETCEVVFNLEENTATSPEITCPGKQTLDFGDRCEMPLPDYRTLVTTNPELEVVQTPEPGTLISYTQDINFTTTLNGETVSCNMELEVINPLNNFGMQCPLTGVNIYEIDPSENGIVVNFEDPVVTGGCGFVNIQQTGGPASGSLFPLGETLVKFTAIDEAGNELDCSFGITVIVNEVPQSPTFTCPDPNQTTVLELDENCTFSVPDYSGRITNFQNFTNEPFFVQTQVRNENVLAVTISVFDGSNGEQAGSCQFLVNLEDQITPEVTCPNDILIPYTDSKEYKIEDYFSQLTITDNCSDSFTYIQTPQPGSIVSENTRIEFTIFDENNNQSGCNFEVKFYKESELQILNCPSDQIFEVDSDCSYLIPDIASTITTNIEGAVVTQNITPGFRVNGSLQLIITAKFEGQTDTCFVDLMAKDSTAPVVVCLEDQNETFDSENGFIIPNYSLQAQTSDNCFIAKIDQIPDVGTEVFEDTQVTIGVEDISGNYSTCTFTVFLTEEITENTLPIAVDDIYSIDQDAILSIGSLGVLANDTDPDNDVLTAILQISTSNGNLTLNSDGSFTYTPDNGYFGTDVFTYVANDGTVNSNIATVTINVENNPTSEVIAFDDEYEVFNTEILNVSIPGVLINDIEPNNRPLFAVIIESTTNGILTLENNGSFTYTPNRNFIGSDFFTYVATNNADSSSNVANVTINVKDISLPNSTSIAFDDAYEIDQDAILSIGSPGVLANDTDPDNDVLTAILQTSTSNGNLTLNSDGSFTYTPNNGYFGTDTFTYVANDGTGNSNVATVTITVTATTNTNVICKESVILELDENGLVSLDAANLFTSRPADLQFSLDQEVFTCADLGENTVTLVYSNNEVQSFCEVKIVVNDVSPPVISLKNISVPLNEFGSITITPEMLNNGTSDNCENLSYSLSKQTFGCKDLGANTVTFTATDASGNFSIKDAIVTVTGDCNINPLPEVEYIFIYPNPTSGPFQFATPAGVTIQRVEVFDFRGRIVMFKDYSESDLEYTMDLTGVQNAVYILNLFTSEGMDIIRVIID